MAVRALGWRTDLMIRRLADAEIDDRGDYIVVSSPANPRFHWGNFVVLLRPPGIDDAGWIEDLLAAEFPAARHRAIGIDGVDGRLGDPALAARLDVVPELGVVMTAAAIGAVPPVDPALGPVALRPVEVDDAREWEQLMTLRMASADEEIDGEDYLRARHAESARMVRHGHGAWFGAFVDGVIRAELGIFTDGEGIARYQFVGTHPDFRRRGLTSALVASAGQWALASLPGVRELVIIADAGGPAARIYRRVGFRDQEWQAQLYNPGT